MLTCREVAEHSDDWLDQNLSIRQALQVRLHLAICKGCDRFIGQMRLIRDLTRAAERAGDDDQRDGERIDSIFSQLHDGKQNEN